MNREKFLTPLKTYRKDEWCQLAVFVVARRIAFILFLFYFILFLFCDVSR